MAFVLFIFKLNSDFIIAFDNKTIKYQNTYIDIAIA